METIKGPDSPEENLLNQLVDQYQAVLLQMSYMYLHDRALAEDAVQETYLKAFRALDSFRGESSEKTWLMRIAINTCRDMQRSAWFRHIDRRITPEDRLSIPVPVVEDFEAEELAQAIVKLPPKYKEVVLLYYFQDMTMNEIAQLLGVAVSSVSGRLKQACVQLRRILEKEGAYGR